MSAPGRRFTAFTVFGLMCLAGLSSPGRADVLEVDPREASSPSPEESAAAGDLAATAPLVASAVPVATPAPGVRPLLKLSGEPVQFLEDAQSLVLRVKPGTVPAISLLARPLRVLIELPGVALPVGKRDFDAGMVTHYEVVHVDGATQIVLGVRRRLPVAPVVAYYGDRAVISIVPHLAPPPTLFLVPLEPITHASPRERSIPRPTSSPSNIRITPKPIPQSSATLPPMHDIPPIHGSYVPERP